MTDDRPAPERVRSAAVTLDKLSEFSDDRRAKQILTLAIDICDDVAQEVETD